MQIRFFREGRRPEACSERGVCHPRKVSGEFRGVVPRPLVLTQTPQFGVFWCKNEVRAGAENELWGENESSLNGQFFFTARYGYELHSCQFVAPNSVGSYLDSKTVLS